MTPPGSVTAGDRKASPLGVTQQNRNTARLVRLLTLSLHSRRWATPQSAAHVQIVLSERQAGENLPGSSVGLTLCQS